jgi:glycosyltransferase involved in cell wall biosynthesis
VSGTVPPHDAADAALSDLRVLTVAFAGTDQAGVHRKLAEQLRAMRAIVPNTRALVFADSRVAPAPSDVPYTLFDVPGGGFDLPSRAIAFHAVWDAVQQHAPDVVYVRYPIYDGHVLRFVRESPPVVFEIQTKFDLELPTDAAEHERRWAARVLPETAGLVAVTPEILDYETARAGWAIPGHVMPNGADPETIPFTPPTLATDRIDLVCVASFYPWHGIDRLIAGLAAERDVNDVHLHLVGDGVALAGLMALATDLGVADRVHAHGRQPVHALDPWYARAHIAIGSLAPHRVGLRELAALKHREYALRGLPMILGGGDADFPTSLPWVRTVPADDSPISPRALRAFALGWTDARRRAQIRTWAASHLAWSAKVPGLVRFLRDIAAAGGARGAGRRAVA